MKSFDQLARECSAVLRESGADEEIVTAGHEALQAARRATDARNRVVHDMWLPAEPGDDPATPRWNSFGRSSNVHESYDSPSPGDLMMVVEAHTDLLTARVRVSGLFMALHAIWPPDSSREASSFRGSMPRYLAMMRDRFTLHENGDIDFA